MSIRYSGVAGGPPSSTGGLTHHMMNNTIDDPDLTALLAYYSSGNTRNGIVDAAYAIHDGRVSIDEATEKLMLDWTERNPEPDRALMAAAITQQYPHGIPPDHPDPYLAIEQATEAWEIKRQDIEDRIYQRLDILVDRIDKKLLDAPVGIVQVDIHPSVERGLGIPKDGLLADQEISALLAGRTVTGEPIEGKRYAAAREDYTPIGSYGFVVSPDKTISVAWGLATDPEEKNLIMQAHLGAARDVMQEIAKAVGNVRYGAGSTKSEPGHVGWIEFTHHTALKVQAERGDPDIHTHFFIPNAVFAPSGRVGALDTAALRTVGMFKLDQAYHRHLGERLREAGFATSIDPDTKATTLSAIPKALAVQFSKVTNEAKAIVAADPNSATLSPSERAQAVHDVANDRERKIVGGRDDKADFAGWKAQAQASSWEPPASLRDSAAALLHRVNEIRQAVMQRAHDLVDPMLRLVSQWTTFRQRSADQERDR